MSKKNSSVNLENYLNSFKGLSRVYLEFKKKLDNQRIKSLVVAVSGGPDSLALAALTKAYSYNKKLKVYFVLINHNLRKNSLQEARKVKLLLKKKIFLHIISNNHKITKNIQSQARKIRYDLLSKFCKNNKVRTILTGHNLEDQVETFFIRLSRGSGLTGLSSMRPLSVLKGNIKLFRPLLDVEKKTLIKISKSFFGLFIQDPSNKNSKFLRTKIRNLKKPLRLSGINYEQIKKSIDNLASSREALDKYYKRTINTLVQKSRNEVFINLKKLKECSNELKLRAINESIKYLRKNYYNPRSIKVLNMVKKVESKTFKKSTLGGCIFIKKKDTLCLKPENI